MITFDALNVSLELAAMMREPLRQLRRLDRSLADQAERALGSVVLNLGEGRGRLGKDRRYHFSVSSGSAQELKAAVRLSAALHGLEVPADAHDRLDRVCAMTWRLTH